MQVQEQKNTLAAKLMQKFFGAEKTETAEVAAEIQTITKSGEDFLTRAIKLFNRKNDLEVAYENDTDALDGQGGGWGLLSGLSVLAGAATIGIVVLSAPYSLGFAAALLASPVALGVSVGFGVLAVVSGIKQSRESAALGMIEGDLNSAHSEATATLKTEIESMQISLLQQTPDVREQFNRAYELSLKKTEIFENKIAAENEAEALEELADAKRAQAAATTAAAVTIATSMRR